jgi:hypothetical protein
VSGGHQGTQGYQKHTASDAGNGELRGIFDINDAMSLQANVGFSVKKTLLAYGLKVKYYAASPAAAASVRTITPHMIGVRPTISAELRPASGATYGPDGLAFPGRRKRRMASPAAPVFTNRGAGLTLQGEARHGRKKRQ